MADELRERARKFHAGYVCDVDAYCDPYSGHTSDCQVGMLERFATSERALAIEECAKICDGLQDEYRESADQLDAAGFHEIANHDLHGLLTCEEIALTIRKLNPPLPTDGEDFGDVSEDQK